MCAHLTTNSTLPYCALCPRHPILALHINTLMLLTPLLISSNSTAHRSNFPPTPPLLHSLLPAIVSDLQGLSERPRSHSRRAGRPSWVLLCIWAALLHWRILERSQSIPWQQKLIFYTTNQGCRTAWKHCYSLYAMILYCSSSQVTRTLYICIRTYMQHKSDSTLKFDTGTLTFIAIILNTSWYIKQHCTMQLWLEDDNTVDHTC